MATAYNKVTRTWTSTDTPENLTPVEDWVVDPIFADFERCQVLGPKYWKYNPDGVTISSMTDQEINTNSTFVLEACSLKRNEINQLRDIKISGGFVDSNLVLWSTTPTDIANLNAVCTLIAVGAVTGDQVWRDASNVDHTVTITELITLSAQMAVFARMCYIASWAHKTAVETLTSITDIQNYDISTGWPS